MANLVGGYVRKKGRPKRYTMHLSFTDGERKLIERLCAAFHDYYNIRPSRSLLISLALIALDAEVSRGYFRGHDSLRIG